MTRDARERRDVSPELKAAMQRTDEAARIARGLPPTEPQKPEKRDIPRTTYVLGIVGICLIVIAALLLDSWYARSLVKYPPDRPLTDDEIYRCDYTKANGWTQSPVCKYR